MNRVAGVLALLVAGLAAVALGTLPAGAATSQAESAPVTVRLNESRAAVGPGQKVRFSSTVRNESGGSVSGLVVHLAILTSDADVYVDPEDWSPRRTQYVDELGPGEEATLDWDVQAVTAGPIILYVAVTDPASGTVAVSGPLNMTVGGRREVNAEKVLPLVAGVPAALVALLAVTGIRRRVRR